MRVAAIDVGTNSVLLLVAERRAGELVPIVERATITRLGQGVDASRALAPEAAKRTLACLSDYAGALRELGVDRLDVVGTSALRDAAGGADFVERATELLGVAPRVISGDEEAALTFEGALAGLGVDGDVTVFDVGGGSTEIIVGRRNEAPRETVSLDIGSVRLTERHLRADPPSARELENLRDDVRAALAQAPLARGSALVGVAGTVTTLAAYAHGIVPYDGARAHGAKVSAERVRSIAVELAALSLEARRNIPAIDPARADVIVAGALLVAEIVDRAAASELIASDRGVRWGIALRLARS